MKQVKLRESFDFLKKSKLKAGDGLNIGKYPFYTSSKRLSKYINEYQYKGNSLVFGTGGKASVHLAREHFSTSSDCITISPKKELEIHVAYIYFYLKGNIQILEDGFQGAGLKHISKTYLSEITIPLPPLPEQIRIAALLSKVESLIAQRKTQIQQLDTLLKSVFIDLFGDPVENEKGWPISSLINLGEFKNGINFKKGESGFKIRYLGVGDFKDNSKLDDIQNLELISLNNFPQSGYLLNDGDLVFVRSNGNRKLVGRCMTLYPDNAKVTFGGFCIRYRIDKPEINCTYIAHLFRASTFRESLLKNGQGANIQSINQDILSKIPIPIPPLSLQSHFATIVEKVERLKTRYEQSLRDLKTLYTSLSHRAFTGQLDLSRLAPE